QSRPTRRPRRDRGRGDGRPADPRRVDRRVLDRRGESGSGAVPRVRPARPAAGAEPAPPPPPRRPLPPPGGTPPAGGGDGDQRARRRYSLPPSRVRVDRVATVGRVPVSGIVAGGVLTDRAAAVHGRVGSGGHVPSRARAPGGNCRIVGAFSFHASGLAQ